MKEPTHFGLHSLIRSPPTLILVVFLAIAALLVISEHRLHIVTALAVLLISAGCLGVVLYVYRYGARTYDSAAWRKSEISSDRKK